LNDDPSTFLLGETAFYRHVRRGSNQALLPFIEKR
jgi:hypothetical protein